MDHDDAVALIRAAVTSTVTGTTGRRGGTPGETRVPGGVTWLDLGCGDGTFTLALAALLPPDSRVVAVDRDAGALARLRRRLESTATGARVDVVSGDLRRWDLLPPLTGLAPHGVLLANALHFVPHPDRVLARTGGALAPEGAIVVVEYDGRGASPWVPHPVPVERLREAAERAGLGPPRVVARRPSAYGGVLYCARLTRRSAPYPAPDSAGRLAARRRPGR